jgi:hypothetical protein
MQLRQQVVDVGRLVLPVAVHLGSDVVAVAKGVLEAGLHRAADSHVERVPDDDPAARLRLGRGVVDRAVIDHDHVEVRGVPVDVAYDAPDHPLLVVCGDDRELAKLMMVAHHCGYEGGSGGLQDPSGPLGRPSLRADKRGMGTEFPKSAVDGAHPVRV